MLRIYNIEDQNTFRRDLRHTATPWEVKLWARLKGRGFLGYKFHRQHGIGRFVMDFYCPKLMLAIELDGSQHFDQSQTLTDHDRQKWIEDFGILLVRYTNDEIDTGLDSVLEDLARRMGRRAVSGDHPWLLPSPPHRRRGWEGGTGGTPKTSPPLTRRGLSPNGERGWSNKTY